MPTPAQGSMPPPEVDVPKKWRNRPPRPVLRPAGANATDGEAGELVDEVVDADPPERPPRPVPVPAPPPKPDDAPDAPVPAPPAPPGPPRTPATPPPGRTRVG